MVKSIYASVHLQLVKNMLVLMLGMFLVNCFEIWEMYKYIVRLTSTRIFWNKIYCVLLHGKIFSSVCQVPYKSRHEVCQVN